MSWFSSLWNRLKPKGDPGQLASSSQRTLENRLGYCFKDEKLLVKALKHRSYVFAEGGRDRIESNERLEFLGDAVLEMLVTEFLFRRFKNKGEGKLTQMKSQLVRRTVLTRQAERLGLEAFVLLSAHERAANRERRPSILGDALEALIGAIYLDGGLEAARAFVQRAVLADFQQIIRQEDNINFKNKLIEYAQSMGSGTPRYLVHSEEGPDHDKIFSIQVSITGQRVGRGRGRSKKEAQQMAAKDALKRLDLL